MNSTPESNPVEASLEIGPTEPLISQIPPPETVRARLAANVREAALLRRLLRLSQRVAKTRDASNAPMNDAQRPQAVTTS